MHAFNQACCPGHVYLMVCVCYEWQRNVMTPNWKPLNVDMTKCLLSFRMYSIKSTVRFEGTLSTHLLLNSPTKSCSPMRAMTTRKKRNKTSTSLRSLRDRSSVFTIARRPKRKERLQKKCSFISQTTVLSISESLSGLNFKYNALKQFSSSCRLPFILPTLSRNVDELKRWIKKQQQPENRLLCCLCFFLCLGWEAWPRFSFVDGGFVWKWSIL